MMKKGTTPSDAFDVETGLRLRTVTTLVPLTEGLAEIYMIQTPLFRWCHWWRDWAETRFTLKTIVMIQTRSTVLISRPQSLRYGPAAHRLIYHAEDICANSPAYILV